MSVEVRTKITFSSWMVPNFAVVESTQSDERGRSSIPIRELDGEALQALAKAWLDELYAKAEKSNPFTSSPSGV